MKVVDTEHFAAAAVVGIQGFTATAAVGETVEAVDPGFRLVVILRTRYCRMLI